MSRLLATVSRGHSRPTTIEGRLRRIEDERDIVDLVLTYAWLCDGRRWDEIWALYTDDFQRVIDAAPSENVRGIEEVRAMYQPLLDAQQERARSGVEEQYHVRGVVAPPTVRVHPDGETAEAIAAYSVLSRHGLAASAPPDLRHIIYLWTLRRDLDGRWRFSALRVLSDDASNAVAGS